MHGNGWGREIMKNAKISVMNSKKTDQHFLQSDMWEKFQQALGKQTIRVNGHLGIVERGKLINKLYFPYLNITDKDVTDLMAEILKIASPFSFVRADFISTSPKVLLQNHWRKARRIQPEDTIINDVSISEESILSKVSKSKRRAYHKNLENGTKFMVSFNPNDVKYFLKLINGLESKNNIKIHDENYFKTLAKTLFSSHSAGLMMAKIDDEVVVARFFLKTSDRLISINAATDPKYNNQRVGAALQVETLLFAHREGLKSVDWWGAAPENALDSHPWAGFTKYKLEFGGERVHYSGTWELPIKKMRYRIYKTIKKLLRRGP
jgi:lipid II:glycine glycyltransferase (peptidoglycan interpeptide bridge formation enzyme)